MLTMLQLTEAITNLITASERGGIENEEVAAALTLITDDIRERTSLLESAGNLVESEEGVSWSPREDDGNTEVMERLAALEAENARIRQEYVARFSMPVLEQAAEEVVEEAVSDTDVTFDDLIVEGELDEIGTTETADSSIRFEDLI